MSPRFWIFFSVLYVVMLFGEWWFFFRGFDTSLWDLTNWLLFVFVLVAEAGAVAIIVWTVDRALPAFVDGDPVQDIRPGRRSARR